MTGLAKLPARQQQQVQEPRGLGAFLDAGCWCLKSVCCVVLGICDIYMYVCVCVYRYM